MQVCGGDGASLVKGCLEMRVAYGPGASVQCQEILRLTFFYLFDLK